VPEKIRAFGEICWYLRDLDEAAQRRVVRALAERHDVDMATDCTRLIMNWDEIRTIAADPLVTIGAHNKGHFAIAILSEAKAMEEMIGSADRIERELGVRPAFPMATRRARARATSLWRGRAGFKTAVTTRKGMLFPDHRRHLTALPRVSLNGDYRSLTYTAVYLSGAPFALWNRFQQVNAGLSVSPGAASSG
jgi:hypothetical protein